MDYKFTLEIEMELHLIFRPPLPPLQSQNPQRSPATPAVLLNQGRQIQPKSERKTWYISKFQVPNQHS
jgi:hypothetical protein